MPKKSEIKKVLIIGSGPIVIGQACEFDYSGTQACKALMNEGLEVILVNSNPATIMTDPEIATRVYVEPLTVPFLEKIIETERPDAVIPTLGGQTALNLALQLDEQGILQKYKVQLLGATPTVIRAGEDRETFRGILDKLGAKYPKSFLVRTYEQGLEAGADLGYPIILRPNYTLGGGGGGIAYSSEEYQQMLIHALHESPTTEVLVEASILGWKEFELEVMRDHKGTMVIVCSIENFDPCGVHTGDSITIAPQQTLSDREYQEMRDEAFKIIEEVGIQTGGANIQFAVHPQSRERVVIEMNPRVSRSSALASKATGFPIAKIAALLAVGYSMDELRNDITKVTPTCYEPALDYVVTKIPRFAFEKFAGAKDLLNTQMRSVGEVMGIGRTLQESFMKALASLEFHPEAVPEIPMSIDKISYPNSNRIYHLFQAFRDGKSVQELVDWTGIDPYFLEKIEDVIQLEQKIAQAGVLQKDLILRAKRNGLTDARIAKLLKLEETQVTLYRHQNSIKPCFSQVDTCAGEFASQTPYFYSSYWSSLNEAKAQSESIAVIGSGPNRIGQGIEFDYSCVRGVKALQKAGIPVVMINSNPETVSTDYDTSDFLFFEPLTFEHVSEVLTHMQCKGFVAQLGGQTPISISHELVQKGFQILGSSLQAIDLAEDRALFSKLCRELEMKIPESAMSSDFDQAQKISERIGFPIICRPSYVLGGRRMEVVENLEELSSYFDRHGEFITPAKPALMDQFLAGALEVDVDLVRGKDWLVIGGILEHIEAAGVHSGDSMGVLPPQRLKPETEEKIQELSALLAHKMNIIGHLNLQLAVKNDVVYVLEANPRSSRSVPFIAKATGIPLVDLSILAMLGKTPDLAKYKNWKPLNHVAVKGVVFPFAKFAEADSILGPEMKSTGESMGQGRTYSEALMKAFLSSRMKLPASGEVFLSLREKDKEPLLPLVRDLLREGFKVSATSGTSQFLNQNGIECLTLKKVHEGRPHCVDHIRSGNVSFVINTTTGKNAIEASFSIRRACTDFAIPCLTESDAAEAFVTAIKQNKMGQFTVAPLK